MFRRLFAAVLVAVGFGGAVAAQDAPLTPVLTIDSDRFFAESDFGQRTLEEYADGVAALAAENRQIEDDLEQEERYLTTARETMAADAFRTQAQAFDEKVQEIRRAQDTKERNLGRILEDGRREFLQTSGPVLGQIMRGRGASVILERRSVFGSLDAIDVTAEAVADMNALEN
jgi:Skp family chaperone for outer membrane proteins